MCPEHCGRSPKISKKTAERLCKFGESPRDSVAIQRLPHTHTNPDFLWHKIEHVAEQCHENTRRLAHRIKSVNTMKGSNKSHTTYKPAAIQHKQNKDNYTQTHPPSLISKKASAYCKSFLDYPAETKLINIHTGALLQAKQTLPLQANNSRPSGAQSVLMGIKMRDMFHNTKILSLQRLFRVTNMVIL